MFKLISSTTSIGLESTSQGIKGASLVGKHKTFTLLQLFTLDSDQENVKLLYIHHPLITTGLEGKEILVRSLHLPLTKDKDIEAALAFQSEPLLPYAVDQALLAYQMVSKTQENSDLTLLATRKETVQAHLEYWQNLQIEPEKVACTPSALCQFGNAYLSPSKTYLILHLQHQAMTCVLIKEGKLMASFSQTEGLELLVAAQRELQLTTFPQSIDGWQALEQQSTPLAQAFKRLQKEIIKMSYALAKELKGESIEALAITGEATQWKGLSQALIQKSPFSLLECEATQGYSVEELMSYAIPIGLALGSLPNQASFIDFRQQQWSYPHPWQRLRKPVAIYFAASALLSLAFYFFGYQYLHYQEERLKQTYIDLLAGMHKSHHQLEMAFANKKNSKIEEQSFAEIPLIEHFKREELMERLAFLQKELQSTPDSFPLFANIPRVSDVLAWLSQHPAVAFLDSEGHFQTRLQIESFTYTMLKRPQQGKKQEKYQVKVEMEFSSPTPKWAREFHDALIAPNEWVDPKGEVKWSSNRGKYKTSFFLKDKTVYPSG